MTLKDADEEQSKLVNKFKSTFLNNVGFFLSAREKILNNFESKIFLIKNLNNPTPVPAPEPARKSAPEPTKEQTRKSLFKLCENFINEIVNGHACVAKLTSSATCS